MLLPRILAHLGRPLRLLNRRLKPIEALLDTPISAQDEKAIRQACAASGNVRFGEFYHWYFQKLIVSKYVRGIDRVKALSLIQSVDRTDYGSIEAITSSATGILIAIPHHSHYIFSMIALAERLRKKRRVLIFYGQPSTHRGNEVFDQLHGAIWGSNSNVEVIHDTRQGMAKAIRSLKSCDIVFIMPDVFRKEEETLVIPFCGRPLNIMLGTAALAQRTGAWILPVIPTSSGSGMGFRTVIGKRIDYDGDYTEYDHPEMGRIAKYGIMRKIFSQYESIMKTELLYWQNMRMHLSFDEDYRELPKDKLRSVMKLLSTAPDIVLTTKVVDLRDKRMRKDFRSGSASHS